MRIIQLLSIFTLCLTEMTAYTQGVDHAPATPLSVASQLDYQYNPNTGTANIQIPLCGISAGNYYQPVSLNYNTSGIQVSQIASRVGLGWELSAEGSVSRIVRGIPDDNNTSSEGYGWLHVDSYDIQDFPLDGAENLRALWIDGVIQSGSGEKDTEPDLFFISLPGINCSFVFGNGSANASRSILLIPYQNIRITYTLDYNGKLDMFIITDNLGNKHYLDVKVETLSTIQTMTSTPDYFITQDYPFMNLSNGIGSYKPKIRDHNYLRSLSKSDYSSYISELNSNRIDVNPNNTLN